MGNIVDKDLNNAPYYDDFNEDDGFQRILFRPGFALQARELNQLQTIINKQNEHIANYFFSDGDVIAGGNLVVNTDVVAYDFGAGADLSAIAVGSEITSSTKKSRVVHKSGSKLFCITITTPFANTDVLEQGSSLTVSSNSPATLASVERGTFYIGGFPLICQAQTVVLSDSSSTPSVKIGFVVTDELITENHDEFGEDLGDNSLGSPNTRAPGAHRLRAALTLTSRALDATTNPSTFIELTRLVNGVINRYEVDSFVSEFGKLLAHRTFEESGNYIVEPFELFINEKGAGANDPFPVDIIGGQAYVRGFEYNSFGKRTLDINPARDTETVIGGVSATFGNYVICETSASNANFDTTLVTPDVEDQEQLELHCTTSVLNTANATQIGTARVVALQPHVNDTIRVYLRDEQYTLIEGTFGGAPDGTVDPILTTDLSTDIAAGTYVGMNIQIEEHTYTIIDSYVDTDPTPDVFVIQISGSLRTTVDNSTDFAIVPEKGNIRSIIKEGSNSAFIEWKADVASTEFDETGRTIFRDTGGSSLLFPFPVDYVESVDNFAYWTIDKVGGQTSNVANIAYTSNLYPGDSSITDFSRYLPNYFAIVTSGDLRGTIAGFDSGEVLNNRLLLTLDEEVGNTDSVDVYTVRERIATRRTKSVAGSVAGVSSLAASVTLPAGVIFDATPDDIISLNVSDGIRINKICNVGSLSGFDREDPTTYANYYDDDDIDVTDKYIFDNGQRDYVYDHASIRLKSGESVSGAIVIHFSYYTHGTGDYFSVNSYAGVAYDDIPEYRSLSEQITYRLSDVLDFRSVREAGADTYTSVVLPDTSFPVGSPDDGIQYDFYLGRKDLITLEPNGDLNVIEGLPAIEPETPEGTNTSMPLFELTLQPFTGDRTEIAVRRFTHKRYGMADIGRIDERLARLEEIFRIASKTLDQAAASSGRVGGVARDIEDIVVTHNNGSTDNVDYVGAYDLRDRYFRPSFDVNFQPFAISAVNVSGNLTAYSSGDEVSNGEVQTDQIQLLPYASEEFIDQSLYNETYTLLPTTASAGYNGYAKLEIVSHPWYDETTDPDVQITDRGWLDKGFGSEWDEWSLRWTGLEDTFINNELESAAAGALKRRGDRFIDAGVIPYVGEVEFDWEVVGMRPNSEIYAYVDGNQIGTASVGTTDGNGFLSSTEDNADSSRGSRLTIDAGSYRAGTWRITFIDHSSWSLSDATTKAEGFLYAEGLPARGASGYVRPEFYKTITTKSDRIISSIQNIAPIGTGDDVSGQSLYPLSQIFSVDRQSYSRGIFLTDVEIFFEEVGGDAPVIVSIREAENGEPSLSTIIEGSVVARVLETADLTSDGGATFTFDRPVYLPSGEDYCITVESESVEHVVRIGRVASPDADLSTSDIVQADPNTGNFYFPENINRKIINQPYRLAFKLNKAVFSDQTKVVNLTVASDFEADMLNFYADTLLLPDTTLSYRENFTSGSHTTTRINKNIFVRTRQDITDLTKNLEITMESDNPDISPVFDMSRIGLVSVLNEITEYEGNSDDSEHNVLQGGNAECRYITKPVYVNQSVNNMTVSIEAFNPAAARIEVYYKVLSDQDSENIDSKSWIRMEAINEFDSTHLDDYRTYSFKPNPEPITYTEGSTTYYTFDTYMLKIVLYSSGTSIYDIPRIRGPYNTGIRIETYLTTL